MNPTLDSTLAVTLPFNSQAATCCASSTDIFSEPDLTLIKALVQPTIEVAVAEMTMNFLTNCVKNSSSKNN
jgi:hypothetical protein